MIFVDDEHISELRPVIAASKGPVYVIIRTLEDLDKFPYMEQLQKVRTNPVW